jgi:hypothetical protein
MEDIFRIFTMNPHSPPQLTYANKNTLKKKHILGAGGPNNTL